jgi:nicotinate phosphoribosyltransferase
MMTNDNRNLALLTDLYQITMAHGYWHHGRLDDEAVFHLFFRQHPFGGGYTVAAGLQPVMEYLQDFRFTDADIGYLRTLTGNDAAPLFEDRFLEHLAALRLTIDVAGVPEGAVVFPHQPLLRVSGPLLQCQLLETALLNIVNFQTLIATKAARIVRAAGGDPVLEFGLRRAQGIDGALAASRAAYLGGCAATSNVLAGMRFGIPVKGTHAHSWVMSHADEEEAFAAYAEAMPNNCVFLVDTYDTLAGVDKAIAIGRQLRARGHELVGIRLDSGDLAWLSIEARKRLDAAGFPQAIIVASNDLDEHLITSLKQQGAAIALWGVGTRLVTAFDQPALGGVYKLAAIRAPGGPWRFTLKLSEQSIKISNPGILNVRRFTVDGRNDCDVIYCESLGIPEVPTLIDPADPTRRRRPATGAVGQDLLVPVMAQGRLVHQVPPLTESRAFAQRQLAACHHGCLRLDHPHEYPVGLEEGLHALKTRLIQQARGHLA